MTNINKKGKGMGDNKTSGTSAVAKSRARVPMKTTASRRKVGNKRLVEADIVVKTEPTKVKTSKPSEKPAPKPAKPATKSAKTSKSIDFRPVSKSDKIGKTGKSTNKSSMKLPKVRRIHLKIRYIILSVAALVVFVFFGRIALWEKDYIAAKEGSPRQGSVAVVEEEEESEVYEGGEDVETEEPTTEVVVEYHVPANRARYITIASIGVYNARVQDIGLTVDGAIDTPRNIYNVGWYTGSVLPGNAGVTTMVAHGGDLGNGIFKRLPRVANGDIIKIEMGDENTIHEYRVVESTLKAIGDQANGYMSTAIKKLPAGATSSLTLITCTGDWYQTQQTYSHRLFVRAAYVRSYQKS